MRHLIIIKMKEWDGDTELGKYIYCAPIKLIKDRFWLQEHKLIPYKSQIRFKIVFELNSIVVFFYNESCSISANPKSNLLELTIYRDTRPDIWFVFGWGLSICCGSRRTSSLYGISCLYAWECLSRQGLSLIIHQESIMPRQYERPKDMLWWYYLSGRESQE